MSSVWLDYKIINTYRCGILEISSIIHQEMIGVWLKEHHNWGYCGIKWNKHKDKVSDNIWQ